MTRRYQLRRRTEEQAETRQRIIDATIAMHQERAEAGPRRAPSPSEPERGG